MTAAWDETSDPARVETTFHRPSLPFHPSHFLILRHRWRRLGQALLAIVLMVFWFALSGGDTALAGISGAVAFVALSVTAIRDERLGYRVDAAIKVVMFLLIGVIMVGLWATEEDGERLDASAEFYREPTFFGVLFIVTLVLLSIWRATDLARWHLQLPVRPLTLAFDQRGFDVRTLRGRAFVPWQHLERVFVAGQALVVSFRPGHPDAEKPKWFRWSAELRGYHVVDLRHFTGDLSQVIWSLAHFAGPAYQPRG